MNRVEVIQKATEYFKGNDLQANVWVDKYCLQDTKGNYLETTPEDMFHRLAKEFVRAEAKYPNPLSENEIYEMFKDFKYVIPGGSILFGLGNNFTYTSLGNCFVIGDSTDSYGSILKIDEEQAQLMKRRGGVGHDLSHLRPAGACVNNAALTSTGAVSFMNRYSNTTREVAQGGRRGALMLTMNIEHPDIDAFIESKADATKLTGCNISVKVTDDFMSRVKSGDEKANKTWDKLVHQAWLTAEPGVLYWDTVLKHSPADKYPGFESKSVNPCGEIPLCVYDTCRLMSINLFSFVNNPFTPEAEFDFVKFKEIVGKAQRLMDDVVDLEEEKIDAIVKKIISNSESFDSCSRELALWGKIRTKLLEGRRTGLSAIGLADAFAAYNIRYGSEESISQASRIYMDFNTAAYDSSRHMANERGAFPAWDSEIDKLPRRNIALLTVPPSGSLSILAGISSGIEPVYRLEYTRRRKVETSDKVAFVDKQGDNWEEYTVYHPLYEQYGKPKSYEGCTSHEVDPIQRVKLQATIQRYIDHSISSTINLPKSVTKEEVSRIYISAWEQGCKGITVYRDGCRDGVLIEKTKIEPEFVTHDAPKRPKELKGTVHKVSIKGEYYSVIVGFYKDKPYEVFAMPFMSLLKNNNEYSIVKEGSGVYYITNSLLGLRTDVFKIPITEELTDEQKAITRLVSTSLRHGAKIKFIVEQLNKIEGDLSSFNKAISRTLKSYIPDGDRLKDSKCTNCGDKMVIENGCEVCKSCGQSKCG